MYENKPHVQDTDTLGNTGYNVPIELEWNEGTKTLTRKSGGVTKEKSFPNYTMPFFVFSALRGKGTTLTLLD